MFNKIEELNNINFKLTKKLMDVETYKAKTEYLGESYEEMKRKVEDLNLENEKVRNITTRLTSQYISEKERSEKFAKDNMLLSRRFSSMVDKNTEYLKKVDLLNDELEVKILESNNLTEIIKDFGNGSTSGLENALTDKIQILENNIKDKNETEISLKNENILLSKKLKKYKDTIGSLIGEINL
jgi:predicted nuclease with TOPRIM domain